MTKLEERCLMSVDFQSRSSATINLHDRDQVLNMTCVKVMFHVWSAESDMQAAPMLNTGLILEDKLCQRLG